MDSETHPPKTHTLRHKCSACFKQYKKKEHLVEHMKTSYHSLHQPKCGVCNKHCRTYESLREHLIGLLSKDSCSRVFSELGCKLCMKILDNPIFLSQHKWTCRVPRPTPLGPIALCRSQVQTQISNKSDGASAPQVREAIALDCEMVGGGSDGSRNLCARVCLIDENENIIFHTYVQPEIPVTDYRSDVTGLTEEHLKDAMPLQQVQEKISEILYNGESIEIVRLNGGKARLLVGHSVNNDLDCLRMNYPEHLIRDTAKYYPLMKTNLVSHSLKYLTQMYLGYDIQIRIHDPYEDCVSAMRLYKRMREEDHLKDFDGTCLPNKVTDYQTNEYEYHKMNELEKLSPNELYELSRSNYQCWCLDAVQKAL